MAQIGELFIKLGFKVDPSQLDALGQKLDALTGKAKAFAAVMAQVGRIPNQGRGGGSGGQRGPSQAQAAGAQANSHVDLFRWQKDQAAKKQAEVDKADAEKKSQQHQQILWLRRLTEVSAKVAVGLTAFNAGLLAVAEVARRGAVGLTNFGLETGISPQTLQLFQAALASRNVSREDTQAGLTELNRQRMLVQFGLGDAQPWQLLGINPYDSAADSLKNISKPGSRANSLNPVLERQLLEQIGLGGLASALKQGDLQPALDSVDRSLLLSPEGQGRIFAMSRSFNKLGNDLYNLGLKVGDFLSRYLTPLFDKLDEWARTGEGFLNWLNSGTDAAAAMRVALYGVLTVVGLLTAAFSALAATSAIAQVASAIKLLGLTAGASGVGGLAKTVAGVGGRLGLYGTALVGGYAAGSWLDNILEPSRPRGEAHKLENENWRESMMRTLFGNFGALPNSAFGVRGGVNQHNSLTVNVDGGNPQAIVKTLNDWHSGVLRQAAANLPVNAPP